MRYSSFIDCESILKYYGLHLCRGEVIDVGGTETCCLKSIKGKSSIKQNPLLKLYPNMILLDKGFNNQYLGGRTDEFIDMLDNKAINHLKDRFDLVFSFDTLEHVTDPFTFCDHLLSITKPGGHIYLSTVFSYVYHPSPEDYFRFSPSGLRQCFVGSILGNTRNQDVSILWGDWESCGYGVAILLKKGMDTKQLPKFKLQQSAKGIRQIFADVIFKIYSIINK